MRTIEDGTAILKTITNFKMFGSGSIVFLMLVILSQHSLAKRSDWTYETQISWQEHYSECSGATQSPINVDSRSATPSDLTIQLHNFDTKLFGFKVNNTGHTVMLAYMGEAGEDAPAISGTALNGETYHLDQLHFHWGQEGGIGSEHSIDGRRYEMELHLVTYNRHKFPSYDEALKSHQGVAVLAMFFMVQEQDDPSFDSIIEMFQEVAEGGGNETIHLKHPFDIDHLLPKFDHHTDFFRYTGSLTTPPCTEGVIWIVSNAQGYIGEAQMQSFRDVKEYQHHTPEGNNYRKLQPLNNRTIEGFNYYRSGCSPFTINIFILMISVFIFFI